MQRLNIVVIVSLMILSLLGCSPPASTPTPTFTPIVDETRTPAPECETHTASLSLSVLATTLAVGESVTVAATLRNQGCGNLGLLQYTLRMQETVGPAAVTPSPVLDPDSTPEMEPTRPRREPPVVEVVSPVPVSHALAVGPGAADQATFVLRAVNRGEISLAASVSYEVHLGSAGPAYWGQSSAEPPLVITVRDEP